MTTYLTPGVYFRSVQRAHPVGPLLRSDVTAFLGYVRRGPPYRPVRIESWRQFLSVCGEPYRVGHLAPAVRSYFDNGGHTCWVARVVDDTASAAFFQQETDSISGETFSWRISAASHAAFLEEPEGTTANSLTASDDTRPPDLGAWGNQLRVTVWRDPSFRSNTVPGRLDGGFVTAMEGLGGLEAGSVVELVQEGNAPSVVETVHVDVARRRIAWAQPLDTLGFDLNRPVNVESVEFAVRVSLGGRTVETLRNLGIHPDHGRPLTRAVSRESRWIRVDLRTPVGLEEREIPWTDPRLWPTDLDVALAGGTDGLGEISATDYEHALSAVARIDEVALLAAPDLVLRPALPVDRPPRPPAGVDCAALLPRPSGVVFGRVITGLQAGVSDQPVRGVLVTDTASGAQAVSDARGEFLLEGVGPSEVILRLAAPGYETAEFPSRAESSTPASPADVFLTPLLLPRSLDEEEVVQVQQAMAREGAMGGYRFALLDPPDPAADVQDIIEWRSRLGDTAYAALYYPWLAVRTRGLGLPDTSDTAGPGLMWVPPSGHVAGSMAATDRSDGVHRAAANRALSHVEDVAFDVKDAQQGFLNPAGVNCIRTFAGRGIRIYGARTLSSDPEWRYVNVRRLVMVLEETLEETLKWVVFEGNDTLVRQALGMSIAKFLNRLWRRGALAGDQPEAAYRVQCNEDNNPPRVRDAGRLIADVSVAPSIPFEFVSFRLGRTLDAIEVTEQ